MKNSDIDTHKISRNGEQILEKINNVVIDVETRNEGFDVKKDNKELLSCQIGNVQKQELFYKSSGSNNFDKLKESIEKMLENNVIFIGYYIEFDLENLRKFLDITIPENNVIDIMNMEEFQFLKRLRNTNYIKLEDACKHLGIDICHKEHMNKLAENLKLRNPNWVEDAKNYIKSNGFLATEDEIARKVNKKAFGTAISKSFDEFSRFDDKNSLFYKYAVGDVVCEFKLFEKLKEMGINK